MGKRFYYFYVYWVAIFRHLSLWALPILAWIHFWLRDDCWLPVVYYGTPLLLLSITSFFGWLISWRKRFWWMFYLMMVGYFSGLWWNQEMVFKREAVWQKMKEEVRAEPSFAVMYWNLNRRKESVDFGLDHVLKNNIDLAVFAEIHQTCYSDIKTFRQQMPGYQIESYLGRFLICSKLPFSLLGVGGFPGNSGYVQMRLDLGDRETELLAVDLMSNPFLNKKTQYEAYYKKLAEMDSPIVLGDFNTPLHSKYLEGMKNLGYHLAKLQSGRGLVATWPYGLPLITLDQVWIPKQEKSLLTEQGNQLSSDHDWLVVRLKK